MNEPPILAATNLHKTFHDPEELKVLQGACLTVHPGESIAIIGKSGEGKSTLLHILGTLEAPCQGEIRLFGEPVTAANAASMRNRQIGFIFQAFNLLEEYTLLDNILMPARIKRDRMADVKERALFLLHEVGLYERRDYVAKRLSGGEKQRAALARALLNDPSLLLADEPTGNLDRAHSQKVHDLLFTACKKLGKGLVIVTHDLELAALCDRTLQLREGKLWTS
jgi:lipoprotein-releasing system ATP-binding protein